MRNLWGMFVTFVLWACAVVAACFVGLLVLARVLLPAIVAVAVCFGIYLAYRYVESMP